MKCFRLFWLFFCGIVVASGFAESRHPLRTRKEEFPISSNKPLEVLVEVSVGEVIIEKSPIEKTLTVWVVYNEDVCELDLEFLPKQNQFYLELANVDKFPIGLGWFASERSEIFAMGRRTGHGICYSQSNGHGEIGNKK